MASWDTDAETTHPRDFRLVHNTFVSMFCRLSLLGETVDWLRSHGYEVVEFDAGAWRSDAVMYDDLARGLHFPDSFGRNLDAVNDCLSDVASGDYGRHPDAAGLVVVLVAFDSFAALDRKTAQSLLDIFASQARRALLIGHRLICLVQSNDPGLRFDPVGATPVLWNDAESNDSQRGA